MGVGRRAAARDWRRRGRDPACGTHSSGGGTEPRRVRGCGTHPCCRGGPPEAGQESDDATRLASGAVTKRWAGGSRRRRRRRCCFAVRRARRYMSQEVACQQLECRAGRQGGWRTLFCSLLVPQASLSQPLLPPGSATRIISLPFMCCLPVSSLPTPAVAGSNIQGAEEAKTPDKPGSLEKNGGGGRRTRGYEL